MQSEHSTRVIADLKDDSNTSESDSRSEMLSRDMSNISIDITNGICVVYEMLRDTSLGRPYLRTTENFTLASTIFPTLTVLKEIFIWGTFIERCENPLPTSLKFVVVQESTCSKDWLCSVLIRLATLQHNVRFYFRQCDVISSEDSCELVRPENVSNITFEVVKDSFGLYETFTIIPITSLTMTQITCIDMLSQTIPLLTHLTHLRICFKNYGTGIELPGSIKYAFIIYKTLPPLSLRHFMQSVCNAKHNVFCKLLFRVDGNGDEYMQIKRDYCKLDSVVVQQFEVGDKQHFVGVTAATLSATSDEDDDEYDKHLIRQEGLVDSTAWLNYCKIRLQIS
ncbi:hypothetical protein DPMN_130437 [Dreissena polymorpha]|uniref:Uncharacterized protein n=1 Tax=Dreissena polymorpha TaxID=45954 RepID=A0A9D4H7R3_DREPO|nr:hypothetical protein DPMN_130437 [Dreissena polymorpha]